MSKRLTESGDWSSDSAALFHSARADHAPSAADRARVRSALAEKLAEASTEAAAGGDAQASLLGKSATRAALDNLAKIGLGVACVMAGAFAFIRLNDWKKPADPEAPSVQMNAAAAKPAERVAEAATPAQDSASTSNVAPAPAPAVAARSGNAPTARVASKRSRARSAPSKVAASRAPAQSQSQSQLAQQRTAAEPAPSDLRSSAFEGTSTSSAAAADSAAQAAIAPRAEKPSSPTAALSQPRAPREDERAAAEESAEARAELAFVERINAAMLQSKLRTVLALCAEHERRWPHGTFVQERDGLRAIASCGSGAVAAATRARTFLASYPRAPLAPKVRDACAPQLTAPPSASNPAR